MLRTRVIPVLLLRGKGLYKTVRFRNAQYVGDPVNTLRIFAEKEADEIVVLDIGASPMGTEPQFGFIRDMASECFMPLAFGGGIRTVDHVRKILQLGVEKVVLNTTAVEHPETIRSIAAYAGSSAVVVSIDVKKKLLGGYEVHTCGGQRAARRDPVELARDVAAHGAGEILITSIDRDGTQQGFDLGLVESVVKAVDVPVIACGGAGRIEHFKEAIAKGAAAVAAGSMFVFQGRHRAVLVSYPAPDQIDALNS